MNSFKSSYSVFNLFYSTFLGLRPSYSPGRLLTWFFSLNGFKMFIFLLNIYMYIVNNVACVNRDGIFMRVCHLLSLQGSEL